MVDGLLPGDDPADAPDPEKIRKEFERLRNPRKPPSEESHKRWVRIDSLAQKQTALRLRRQLPGMTPEQEADITQQLLAVDSELARLLAAERKEHQGPPATPPEQP